MDDSQHECSISNARAMRERRTFEEVFQCSFCDCAQVQVPELCAPVNNGILGIGSECCPQKASLQAEHQSMDLCYLAAMGEND